MYLLDLLDGCQLELLKANESKRLQAMKCRPSGRSLMAMVNNPARGLGGMEPVANTVVEAHGP
jgi:hypothetical protein